MNRDPRALDELPGFPDAGPGADGGTGISILLCTRDNAESLRHALEAIGNAERPAGLPCELLVVDNSAGEATAKLLAGRRLSNGMPLRSVRERKNGKANAMNRGLSEARGNILLFTDDDVTPPRDWITKMCAPILSGAADAVAGAVRLAPELDKAWLNDHQRAWLAATNELNAANPGRMVGANMAFSRAVLEKVPAFDPELGPGALGFGEDSLFSLQLTEAGYRIAGVFDAPVEHHFNEARLERKGWLESARKLGRVDAYLAHHWEHAVWARPRSHLIRSWLRLAASRFLHLRGSNGSATPEGFANASRGIHACFYYLRERRKPRKYDRHGLVKLPGR